MSRALIFLFVLASSFFAVLSDPVIDEGHAASARASSRSRGPVLNPAVLDLGPLQEPVGGKVIEKYGEMRNPKGVGVVFTHGVRVSAKLGEFVMAMAPGEVIFCDDLGGFSTVIVLEHAGEVYSVYGNLGGTHVSVGDEVIRGQVLGKVGTIIDNKTKQHFLHFGVYVKTESQNPLLYLFNKK